MVRSPVAVAILGSGTGSNADALIRYGLLHEAPYKVRLVVSTRAEAGIVGVARQHGVESLVLPLQNWESVLLRHLRQHSIDVLALAGFMRKLPEEIISALDGNVLNVHPALLPAYGGVGMYGLHVHRAVLEAGETVTGATVHMVTAGYDEGAILAQDRIRIEALLSANELQQRVKRIEHTLYPSALAAFCRAMQG